MKKLLLFISLFITTQALASPPTRQNTYVSNTTIRATDVTANEDAIFNYLQSGVDTISDGTIVAADISSSAAIPYSKLSLSNSILNADINSSAGITYSKLNLSGGIVNADISGSAAIADSKLAQITTASKVSGAAITSVGSIPNGAGIIRADLLATGPTASLYLRGDSSWQSITNTEYSFSAYSSNDNNGASDTDITFDTENFDTNNNFSSNTFTAPITGKYIFTVMLRAKPSSSVDTSGDLQILKNGSLFSVLDVIQTTSTSENSMGGSIIMSLAANDTVKIHFLRNTGTATYNIGCHSVSTDCRFTGSILYY